MEGSKRGSILSYASLFLMVLLFVMETKQFFFNGKSVTNLSLDKSGEDTRIRLYFNITMMDWKWVSLDKIKMLRHTLPSGMLTPKQFHYIVEYKDIQLYDESVTESLE